MKKLDITLGKYKLGKHYSNIVSDVKTERPTYSDQNYESEKKYYGGFLIAESIHKKDESLLFCDAGNTYQKCNLLPSELLKQRNELLEALQDLRKWAISKGIDTDKKLFQKTEKAINKALGYEK